jgi:hypothetical protein
MRDAGTRSVAVKGGGLGCSLIRSDVFDSVAWPWFEYVRRSDRSKLSEDYSFCSACARAGIPVLVDTRVWCGHLVTRWRRPT